MKVLFYNQFSFAFGGGGEIWLANVAQHLAKNGMDVTVVTSSKIDNRVKPASLAHLISEKPLFQSVQLRTFTLPLGFPIPYPDELPKLMRCLKSADVIYFLHEMPLVEIGALWYAKKMSHKKVIAVYEGPLVTQMAFLRYFTQAAAKVMIRLGIYDAHQVLNTADERLVSGLGARNVRVIPNGTDLRQFRPRVRQESNSVFEVLFVGRLSHQKGFDIFCDVVEKVNERLDPGKSVRFVVIGSGELETRLGALMRNQENIEHNPYIPHNEMSEYYARASMLLAPYRYEGHPLTIVEAQACGLPVIATALPGISETIIDKQTGVAVHSRNADDFVDPLLSYHDIWTENPHEFELIRAKARTNSLRFSWDRIGDRIMRFISDATAMDA